MSDVENELRVRVGAFVGELSALIRRQALQAVEEVLNSREGVEAPPVRRRGRPPKAVTAALGARAKVGRPLKALGGSKRKAGEKRTPQLLAQIIDGVYNYIKSNGGQGVEQIAKGLATSTKELTLPIRKLLAEKKIGSKGQKRATRYYSR